MALLLSSSLLEIVMIFVFSFVDFKYFSIIGFFLVPKVILVMLALYLLAIYFCSRVQSYGKTAAFVSTISLQQVCLAGVQPLFYIFQTIVQFAGPYGRTLYYPSAWTWVWQVVFILLLYAPCFCLYYSVRRMNLELYG
jgi:hypothetical protein